MGTPKTPAHRQSLQDAATRRKQHEIVGRYLRATKPETFSALLREALDAEVAEFVKGFGPSPGNRQATFD